MRNLIYQYWQGDMKPGVTESTRLMKEYANLIGAEYRFDHNVTIASKTVDVPIYYEPANPLVDPYFDVYDNIALIDIDVFPTANVLNGIYKKNNKGNIFFVLNGEDAAICTEPKQPYFRTIYNSGGITSEIDKKWAKVLKDQWDINYSYDEKDRPKVYNTGVVLISKSGLQFMKAQWPSFQQYVDVMRKHRFPKFYTLFQDYFSAFIHMDGFKFKEMDNKWNCYMHKVGSHPNATIGDNRTEDAKLVHIMFRTADNWPAEALWQITNLPIADWKLPVNKGWPND